ncbi:hypothetical protein RJ55_04710 [Drechmeria coniospora]|nr:hypothetical protein RJ55_04710 [Drechmeria coniospora]
MAVRTPPADPLLVILGSTGTGKSDLAVELATRFGGEIINADAMQLYRGLPVLTNKLPVPERRGIPHHLLGHIAADEAPWDVDDFKREATKAMAEIRARGNLPILVGGTQYYVDSLLFADVILDGVQCEAPSGTFPFLDSPTETLLSELQRCDPVMAERWHPNDRRKIQRSLEIFLQTGKPASQFYAEQRERKAAAASRDATSSSRPRWEKLLFWVHSDRDVLRERLDERVDRMLSGGLLDEVGELVDLKRRRAAAGQALDTTKGIWQSIGYRQFEAYLAALDGGATDDGGLDDLKAKAVEETKSATRRYAVQQTRWIRLKQMRRLQEEGAEAMDSLYVVDSTDQAQFQQDVVQPAAGITAQFLAGEERPRPRDVSERARQVLTAAAEPPAQEKPSKRTCELCQTVLVTEQAWQRHIKGVSHRRALRRKQRLALVPTEERERDEADVGTRPSSPEIGSMFSSPAE